MKRLTLFLFLALLSPVLSSAQAQVSGKEFAAAHGDFFHLFFADKSDLKFNYRYEPDREEDGGPGEYDAIVFGGSLELPLPLSINSFIRAGIEYEGRQYDFRPVPTSSVSTEDETLHKGIVSIGFGHFFNNNLLVSGKGSAGIFSNLEDSVSEDDFNFYGQGYFVYRINPGAQLLFGAGIDETFDDSPVYPLVGIRLLSEDGRLHISVTAPVEARIGYKANTNVELYGGVWISGDAYNVEINNNSFTVQVHDRRLGVGMLVWLGNHVNLSVEGGVSAQSELDFKFSEATQFGGDLDPAPYISAGVGFAL